jgi:hypothetical protein
MRIALAFALGLIAGCAQQQSDPPPDYPPPYYPPGGGGGGGGPPPTYGCSADSQCGTGEACARDGECLPSNELRAVHVTWTVQGAQADQTSCSNSESLELDFTGGNEGPWGYAPVPCMEGKFSIDKLPTWYTYVQLGRDGDITSGSGGKIDPDLGTVVLDLPY